MRAVRQVALALVVASAAAEAAPAAPAALRVVLDPGHGGAQHGAVGPNGLLEKDVALSIARSLKASLESALGAQVLLTRGEDVDVTLEERVARANRFRPDLFLSIHANSMPTRKLRERTEGVETFFLSAHASGEVARSTAARENAEAPAAAAGPSKRGDTLGYILADLQRAEAHADSSRLAYAIHPRLVKASAAADRGVHQAPLFVLMGVESPAVLIEVGYISHPREGRRLGDPRHHARVARALTEAIARFAGELAARERSGTVARPGSP